MKVDGKPVLLVYKTHLFPDIRSTVEISREQIEKSGFPGLFLVMVDDWTADLDHPRQFGFDASYEIPSNLSRHKYLARRLTIWACKTISQVKSSTMRSLQVSTLAGHSRPTSTFAQ